MTDGGGRNRSLMCCTGALAGLGSCAFARGCSRAVLSPWRVPPCSHPSCLPSLAFRRAPRLGPPWRMWPSARAKRCAPSNTGVLSASSSWKSSRVGTAGRGWQWMRTPGLLPTLPERSSTARPEAPLPAWALGLLWSLAARRSLPAVHPLPGDPHEPPATKPAPAARCWLDLSSLRCSRPPCAVLAAPMPPRQAVHPLWELRMSTPVTTCRCYMRVSSVDQRPELQRAKKNKPSRRTSSPRRSA